MQKSKLDYITEEELFGETVVMSATFLQTLCRCCKTASCSGVARLKDLKRGKTFTYKPTSTQLLCKHSQYCLLATQETACVPVASLLSANTAKQRFMNRAEDGTVVDAKTCQKLQPTTPGLTSKPARQDTGHFCRCQHGEWSNQRLAEILAG